MVSWNVTAYYFNAYYAMPKCTFCNHASMLNGGSTKRVHQESRYSPPYHQIQLDLMTKLTEGPIMDLFKRFRTIGGMTRRLG